MAKAIYLDYAAATPMDPAVLRAMEPYLSKRFYNPSATYLAARAVRRDLNDARHKLAQVLGARPAEIIFTAGATEANNLAIRGIQQMFPEGEILASAIEHESVLAPANLGRHKIIPVNKKGIIDLVKLEAAITNKTVLVSIMLVNNELGTIQPLAEIAQLLNKSSKIRASKNINLPLYLHTDAAQASNYLDLHVARLGVDLMSLNGGKIYGPKQSGLLYVKAGVRLAPQIVGGGQEFGLRSGTENVAACIGLAEALALAQQKRPAASQRIMALRQKFESGLSELSPAVQINGAADKRAPHIVSATFQGVDNERLMMELDEAGIQAAVGSACSASSDEPSHVLAAIGLSDEQARSSLRFSLGRQTTETDVNTTLKILQSLTTVK